MFNRGEVNFADTAIAADGVDHQEALGSSFPPHLKKVVTTLRTGFPDLHFEVHKIISEGDTVACRSTMTGTHLGVLDLGPLAAIEPVGLGLRGNDGKACTSRPKSLGRDVATGFAADAPI